jgi:hypothetical protein
LTAPTDIHPSSETVNVLSVPHIEEKIAEHQRQIEALAREAVAQRYPRIKPGSDWFYCNNCGALYQAFQGCGCAIPPLIEELQRLRGEFARIYQATIDNPEELTIGDIAKIAKENAT